MTIGNIHLTEEQVDFNYTTLYGDAKQGKSRAEHGFLMLRMTALEGLKSFFSRGEMMAILDSFKKKPICNQVPNVVETFMWHMKDAEEFEGLLTKRSLSVQDFMDKISTMQPILCFFLQEEIDRFWHMEGAYGEKHDQVKFLNLFC